jgi:serine/threonine protein kinase
MGPGSGAHPSTLFLFTIPLNPAALTPTRHTSYYDVVRAPKAFYLVMEYGSGGDLATLLAKRASRLQPLSEDHSLTWLQQLLDATAYLHRRNLIHR